MAITHLLDTSVYSQPLKKYPLATVQQRWNALGDNALGISIFCEMELLQGLEARNSKRLWNSYSTILEHRLPILEFNLETAKIYAKTSAIMSKQGLTRPVLDLLIAATAQAHNLIIATCNIKDFNCIPGIQVEDWSKAIN
jgi:tRNA(fMet)-specific endonuclease VapC